MLEGAFRKCGCKCLCSLRAGFWFTQRTWTVKQGLFSWPFLHTGKEKTRSRKATRSNNKAENQSLKLAHLRRLGFSFAVAFTRNILCSRCSLFHRNRHVQRSRVRMCRLRDSVKQTPSCLVAAERRGSGCHRRPSNPSVYLRAFV